jgi:hypothetical protein
VPEDADLIVIAGPTRPIPAGGRAFDELAAIEDYVERGGRMIVMLDTTVLDDDVSPSGLEGILEKYGVTPRQEALAAGPEMTVIDLRTGARDIDHRAPAEGRMLGTHEISEPLARYKTFFFGACCLETDLPEDSAYRAWKVVEGTEGSWGETDLDRPGEDESDVKGPTVLVAAVGPDNEDDPEFARRARIVVFADADFVANDFARMPLVQRRSANLDLFANAASWAVGRREDLVKIPPKERERRTVDLKPKGRTRLFWGAVIGPVVLMIALGIYAWWARSR